MATHSKEEDRQKTDDEVEIMVLGFDLPVDLRESTTDDELSTCDMDSIEHSSTSYKATGTGDTITKTLSTSDSDGLQLPIRRFDISNVQRTASSEKHFIKEQKEITIATRDVETIDKAIQSSKFLPQLKNHDSALSENTVASRHLISMNRDIILQCVQNNKLTKALLHWYPQWMNSTYMIM